MGPPLLKLSVLYKYLMGKVSALLNPKWSTYKNKQHELNYTNGAMQSKDKTGVELLK